MKKNGLFIALVLPLLVGCGMQKKMKSTEFLEQQEIIAKYGDLPDAPFQAQLKKIAVSSENHQQLQIFYTFTVPTQDIVIFYKQQMERLGWDLFAESTTQDYLMHYSKPQELCSFLVKDNNLSIYMCNKKGA